MAATQRAMADAAAPADREGLLRIEGARGRYTRVPNALLDDTTLSARQRDLWALIHRRDWQGEGWVFSHEELAHIAGCGVATLARTLTALEARGLVRVEGSAKRPKRYFAVLPEWSKGGPPEGLQAGSDAPEMIDPNPHDDRSDPPHLIDPIHHDDRSAPEIPYIDQRRIKDDQSAAAQQHAAPPPDSQESAETELTGHAVAVAILEAQGRPASPAAVARMAPACTDEVTEPYCGQVTLAQIKACLGAMRRKKFFREKPHALTPRRLGEDLGPWLRQKESALEDAPRHRVLCACLTRAGYPHSTAQCGLSGKVSPVNYREQGRPWVLHTPAGVVEEREDDHGSSTGG